MIKGVKKFMENEFKILKLIFKYFPKKKKKKNHFKYRNLQINIK